MKPTITHISIIIIAALLLSACTSSNKVVPVYSNARQGTYRYTILDDKKKPVSVDVGFLPIPPTVKEEPKVPNLWDLRDSLPHLLVKTMSNKVTKPQELYEFMSNPINPPKESKKETAAPKDYTEVKFRVNVAVVQSYMRDSLFVHDNTRLATINTSIAIPQGSNLRFSSIDRLQNQYDEVDLGALERNKSITMNAKLGLTGQLGTSVDNTSTTTNNGTNTQKNGDEKNVYDEKGTVVGKINSAGEFVKTNNSSNTSNVKSGASVGVTGEVGYLDNESIKEAINVKLKTMSTGFAFTPEKITVMQLGKPNGDVSQNTLIDVSLSLKTDKSIITPVYTFKGLFDDQWKAAPASKVTFSERTITYNRADGAKDIELPVKFEALIRAVENHAAQPGTNKLEYDDQVHFYYLDERGTQTVKISPLSYSKEAYKVTIKGKDSTSYNLVVSWTTTDDLHLFIDDKPAEFIQWLGIQLANPTAAALTAPNYKLFFSGPSGKDNIMVVGDKIDADAITKIRTLDARTLLLKALEK